MKQPLFTLAAVSAVLCGFPAAADVAGAWRVEGKVSTFTFTLTCDFKPDGARLSGVCVDASTSDPKIKGGKSHPLTAGSIAGDKVSWTYRSSFLISRFDVTFTGTLSGDRMSGAIDASGHQGTFSATRR